MADETIEIEPAAGGAHKSFWSHLEDLRKVLLRSLLAVGVALLLCLTFVDRLVAIVEYPLRNIDMFEKPRPTVSFEIGETRFGPYAVTRQQFAGLPPGPAPHVVFQVQAARIGPQQVAALRLVPDATGTEISPLRVRLHNFGPAEGFFVAFHVAFYSALILSAPFWMYFIVSFILPALKQREREAVFPWLAWSVFLFLAGDEAPSYLSALNDALSALGEKVTLGRQYRSFYDEMKQKNPRYVGFDFKKDQEYLLVVGPRPKPTETSEMSPVGGPL